MSPLMMRLFTLAGIALAASMQVKARAADLPEPHVQRIAMALPALKEIR